MAVVESKPFWKSSTFWINALPVGILVIEELIMGGVLPDRVLLYLTVLLNILNRLRAPEKVKPLSLT